MVIQVYVDDTGLRHLADYESDKTYCDKPTADLEVIDRVVGTGTYCTTCHIVYHRKMWKADSNSDDLRDFQIKDWNDD